MGNNASSLAVLDNQGRVITFIRSDVPEGWQPPEGTTVIPDDELPQGWTKAPPTFVPKTISARQVRIWLIQNGISLATVEAAIDTIPDVTLKEITKVEWEYAPYIERDHPMLVPLAQALGLTQEQLDQAFIEAQNI